MNTLQKIHLYKTTFIKTYDHRKFLKSGRNILDDILSKDKMFILDRIDKITLKSKDIPKAIKKLARQEAEWLRGETSYDGTNVRYTPYAHDLIFNKSIKYAKKQKFSTVPSIQQLHQRKKMEHLKQTFWK